MKTYATRDSNVSDDELFEFVATSLAERREGGAALVDLQRRRCAYSSSFSIEELTAHLSDGEARPLIFKNMGHEQLSAQGRAMRPEASHRPDRECFVYRQILPDAGLSTATCDAAAVDVDRGRYWLLLERVPGDQLSWVGDFAAWLAVARWLAKAHDRLHDLYRRRQVAPELARYDGSSFHAWVDRAEPMCELKSRSADAARPRALRRLFDQCRVAADETACLPRTIIHGEFYPSNVIVDTRADRHRICPVDWETAGVGCGLLDVAALVAGKWSELQKDLLVQEYLAALCHDPVLGNLSDPLTALRRCRLLLAMKWIGWSPHWQPPSEHRYDWLGEALHLAEMLAEDRSTISEFTQPAP
jgi:aminoglycoside phosphotransferase